MTINEIKKELIEIEKLMKDWDDYEAAHGREDYLREKVLKEIASGKYSERMCVAFANEVLKTSNIRFHRWCS